MSSEAVSAIKEEFTELEPLLEKLSAIARTPVAADDLQPVEQLLSLAQEVGLLSVYDEADEEVLRYKVPDLYRLGLGMTRRGQA